MAYVGSQLAPAGLLWDFEGFQLRAPGSPGCGTLKVFRLLPLVVQRRTTRTTGLDGRKAKYFPLLPVCGALTWLNKELSPFICTRKCVWAVSLPPLVRCGPLKIFRLLPLVVQRRTTRTTDLDGRKAKYFPLLPVCGALTWLNKELSPFICARKCVYRQSACPRRSAVGL